MKYYSAEWNGHTIRVENTMSTERVLFDDKVIAENKSGIRLAAVFDTELPDTDGLHCFVCVQGMEGSFNTPICYGIIGRPLKAEYDKSSKVYSAEYNGHKIETSLKGRTSLSVDGQVVNEGPKGLHFAILLGSKQDENGKRYLSLIEGSSGSGLKLHCYMFADAEPLKLQHYKKKGEEFILDEKFDKYLQYSFEEE